MKINIFTKKAPKPIGAYSQAVYINNFLYISGQIALDPKTEKIISGDIDIEMYKVMKNLDAILKEANMTLEDVIKVTIFLKNINDFDKMNRIYSEYFMDKSFYPAREVVEVSGLPKCAKIEISLIAYKILNKYR